ncbi:hypothetical protein F4553_002013 [Allocatelliglobosispora scoriae]|uniref:Uncharacterized protein n=1 Tax=Allocatelliglobosispora scoriae TaxID=643052 RepID=A0A841BK39_9ACTN|nr:hypothetical protein [Allocatelliglobosispora scoriae]MBB5868634.1 hypothetical protein [Allocatelliglobosispora scoriae]
MSSASIAISSTCTDRAPARLRLRGEAQLGDGGGDLLAQFHVPDVRPGGGGVLQGDDHVVRAQVEP